MPFDSISYFDPPPARAPRPGFSRKRTPKQAKMLDALQFKTLVHKAGQEEHPVRALVAVYLSYYAALRAQEIALLRWDTHVLDVQGRVRDTLTVTDDIGKKEVGRIIPMHPELRRMLITLRALRPDDTYVFHPISKRAAGDRVTPSAVCKFFLRLYEACGFKGATSHSGRRTFITAKARTCNLSGHSLRDVQEIAGHLSIATTQGYIDRADDMRGLVTGSLFA